MEDDGDQSAPLSIPARTFASGEELVGVRIIVASPLIYLDVVNCFSL